NIMLPNFPVPPEFASQDDYLRHLTFAGARERYKELNPELEERINFELHTITVMGYAGYFLIVADFIKAGREIGVFIGPGRGSAAGSVVAYCIGITNIDPIKYQLLFERFLNPGRKSLPDIDTDFDDEGRQKVIDYVVQKYGKNQVAQIVTYGSMAAKMSIKDVARVLDLPLVDSNILAKLVPDRPGIELNRVINAPLDGEKSLKESEGLQADEMENVKKLREIHKGDDLRAKVLKEALILEGSVRGTGVHAAGIIIAPQDLTELIPVAVSKDSDLLLTQFDGKVIENAGVIKMDFLGLKNLSIIRDALKLIKQNTGIEIDLDNIPLDDKPTLELFAKGETNGTFQFESAGMQKYLKELKPDRFEDLIAMNALYRPGPMAYIPNYINRKHGKETVEYDLPEMGEYLKDTYGITVYQEQVMLISQKLAGFSLADADDLRKAMGKKDHKKLAVTKPKFMEGAFAHGHDPKKLEKIWIDWEAFASYAFNKSHSTCYALVAFQTGYLKSHYPAEYMASVLTHNKDDIDKVTFFMNECKRMGIRVLGPDVNESQLNFAVNKKGEIRFGLGAVKGVGSGAVEAIITEREAGGHFKNIFDLVQRVNLRAVNKKTLEGMALAGAFDCFANTHRAQYFQKGNDDVTIIEKAIRFGNTLQNNELANQQSLFGGASSMKISEPSIPECEPWGLMDKLRQEKEVTGMYISGHPLDDYQIEFNNFNVAPISSVNEFKNRELNIAGIVTDVFEKTGKNNKVYATVTIEDYSSNLKMTLWSEDYLKFKHLLTVGQMLYIKGSMKPRFNSPDQFELRVNQVVLLAEVREKFLNKVTLTVHSADIQNGFLKDFKSLLENFKGNALLKINIRDDEQKMGVGSVSTKVKIAFENELIKKLEEMNIDYKLN
ncbi:MAG: DNA polymerase III subunit alpha, partial [Bacteroidia bacterium]